MLPLFADLAPEPVSNPIPWVIAAVVIVGGVVLALRSRAKKPSDPGQLQPGEALALGTSPASQKVAQAEAELARAKADREAAEAKARTEAAERESREEAARQKAADETARVAEAEARAKAARDRAEKAEGDDRKRALEEAQIAEAEVSRRRKEIQEAERKAAYEARKGDDAEAKAKRRADEEAKKQEALEAVKAAAEAEARTAALKARKIEAESGRTLSEGLSKTRGGFMARLASLVGASTQVDDKFIAELEEILFTADIGPKTATRMLEVVREKLKRKELASPDKVKAALREEMENILTLGHTYEKGGMPAATGKPQVVMVVGVNGSGKTTTIGKLAFKEKANGRKVLVGAGDTFRAAAVEQLDVWADRAEVELVRGPDNGDPASVCFEATKKAVDAGFDLCILDTAGRLHTNNQLMDELAKVKRVVTKALPGAPHETWLVVDGTTGQNALAQARQFHEALGLTGLVLTKLDGTAKGGVVIGICDELKVPVRYAGVGEKIGDLRAFDPKEFIEALFAEG